MSTITHSSFHAIPGGNLVVTVLTLTANSDSVELPRMTGTSNKVAQLLRPGDTAVTVSQSDVDTVNLTGTLGQSILLVSHSDDPIPNPTGQGA